MAMTMDRSGQETWSLVEALLGTASSDDPPRDDDPIPRTARHGRSMPRSLRKVASRQRVMAVTVVDQAASSASNFGVAFLIAHYSKASTLGVYAIVQTTYILTQGLVRSLTSDCLLTRHDDDDRVMERYERSGYLSAILCASAISLLILAISTAFTSDLRTTFIIFALSFPLMACQDYARYIGISRYNPKYAVWLDLALLFLFIAAYVGLRHTGHVSMPWIFAAWSVTGAAVGLYTMWNHLSLRHPVEMVKFWFRSEHSVGLRFAGQWVLVSSWTYVAIYLFTLIFSLAVIGQFKLAQLAFGPMTVLTQGVATAMVALAARYFQIDVRRALRFVLLGIIGASAITVVWTVLVYIVPVHTFTKTLGPTWPVARTLVPLMGLAVVISSASSVVVAGLRSLRAAKENLRLAIGMVPILFSFTMVSGVLWGVKGAIVGICVGYGIYAVVGWLLLHRISYRLEREKRAASEEEMVEELAFAPATVGGVAEPAVGPIAAD